MFPTDIPASVVISGGESHIDNFPYNKDVVTESTKLTMAQKCLFGLVIFLFLGGAVGLGVGLGISKNDPTTPEYSSGAYLDEIPPFEPREGFEAMWWDEFDEGELDRSKWTVRTGTDYYYTRGQLQRYSDSPEVINMENQTLSIIANNTIGVQYDGTNYDQTYYTSARMDTRSTGGLWHPNMTANGSTWSTIFVEARMKAARGPGVISAFWMLPDKGIDCWAEIDIFEAKSCDMATGGMWYADNSTSRGHSKHGYTLKTDVCDTWFTVGVEWNSEYIVYYFNDEVVQISEDNVWYGRCDPANPLAPYSDPFYIILNQSIGGSWAGTPQNSIFPAEMVVDYVRVSGIRKP